MTAALSGRKTFRSSDDHPWEVDFERRMLRGERRLASRLCSSEHDLDAPLGSEVLRYIWLVGPAMVAGSLERAADSIATFCRFLRDTDRRRFSPEAFSAYLAWMQSKGLKETTRRVKAAYVRLWISNHLGERQLATTDEIISVNRRFRRHFRGFKKRRADALRETWLRSEDHVSLLRAIRMEIEERRALLDAPEGASAVHTNDMLSIAPFFQLLGLILGVRSAELNVAKWSDLREHDGRLWLHVHAPNKEPGRLFLTDTLVEAWEIARLAMARYRPNPRPEDPLLAVVHSVTEDVVRLDTIWARSVLKAFYRKYFHRKDRNGLPVLSKPGSGGSAVPEPFSLGFVEYRVAAISEYARRERNPNALKRFARHKDIATTLLYYAKQEHLEWLADVANAHKVSTEIARMTQRGLVATREEVARATSCNACVLAGAGICAEGLVGVHRCEKAADCRVCSRFKLNPDRREYFVTDLAQNEARALDAALQGLKRDAQVYEALCALDRACIARIDEHYEDPDSLFDSDRRNA